jgi:hypothetical protein
MELSQDSVASSTCIFGKSESSSVRVCTFLAKDFVSASSCAIFSIIITHLQDD